MSTFPFRRPRATASSESEHRRRETSGPPRGVLTRKGARQAVIIAECPAGENPEFGLQRQSAVGMPEGPEEEMPLRVPRRSASCLTRGRRLYREDRAARDLDR